jgi:hypothetical protein
MKRIAIAAALLSATGSAALAQGCPPGGAWRGHWPGYAEARRAQTMTSHRADSVVASRDSATTRSGSPSIRVNRGANAGG